MQHLLAALQRLDLLIELHLLKFRRQHKLTGPREDRGLYISDEEIAVALQSSTASSAANALNKKSKYYVIALPTQTNKSTKKLQPASMTEYHQARVPDVDVVAGAGSRGP